ncbi:MAG: hypothetical protein A3B74_01590 [Candidatus Kerfeldbacteria bacterium RIFCSPHIGHO2_02_FULL_42_14]|uniref:SHS2 domain-containing protein n=1 Tax=Candidatus Kerfeldbacteria bacterium RIFCSPHIGHO2_02_FULL_42_14 TaxID=1798540 RepID=A0A1G2ATV8_9BACT|nr:MAG: hypothetical protein A3B74_01590 [Candidatus Kerfeldbacteria bacterium RIFCSPHIGHO2_02_FULL_42_14]OGY82311.1 MAG: hypothetical protein A3E60_03790 [Candidatus Kerfeldbacteria bacterium RIFCSPHIGHO2_12_FULL_42_13]OGY84739.1 MAG: hypothetical protein A3I91_05590 [Candidatus Kerfeldbacteria bacterium RIFCSPLOWO2_02_FULL_42_19]OGY85970.1 MAG: hypothetical protein A3G01_03495 [Candidatus Kerfeldbacteria bacterium RIFCSPLOWO2_12_FULL_43_9]
MNMFFQNTIKTFGLDIGEATLRLIACKRGLRSIKLTNFQSIALPQGTLAKGKIINRDNFIRAIQQLITASKIKKQYVVASLPEKQTYTKVFPFVADGNAITEEKVRNEITQHLPYPLSMMIIDWQYFTFGHQSYLAFAAIAKEITENFLQALTDAGLNILAFETEAQAIVRSLVKTKDITGARCMIHIDSQRTTFILERDGVIHFTRQSENFSGNAMTQAIQNAFKSSVEEAERLKLHYGLQSPKENTTIIEALTPLLQTLATEILEILHYYKLHIAQGQEPLREILLSGGVAHTKSLPEALTNMLQMTINPGNPWCNINARTLKRFPITSSLSYTCAIGLALRSMFESENI